MLALTRRQLLYSVAVLPIIPVIPFANGGPIKDPEPFLVGEQSTCSFNGNVLRWQTIPDPDLAGYEITMHSPGHDPITFATVSPDIRMMVVPTADYYSITPFKTTGHKLDTMMVLPA